MNLIAKYVQSLDDEEKLAIIDGFERLEHTGTIGDEPVRQHAEAFLAEIGSDQMHIVMWMQQLAFECYRYYANQWFEHVGYPPYKD